MSDIVKLIREEEDSVYSGQGVSKNEIKRAENKLKVKFSEEYCVYLKEIGSATVNGHELTTVSEDEELDVVKVTLLEKQRNPDIGALYVVERTNIDGIIIWQAASGEIYQAMPKGKAVEICDSLVEYLED